MPQQPSASIENNFTAGLKTEFTGLNFPENAATDADNVIFDYVGNVRRRLGFEYELNGNTAFNAAAGDKAIQTYLWTNAGGDGNTQLLVQQFGSTLYFYEATAATVASPLSTKKLVSTVDLTTFLVSGSSRTVADIECQFTDGNGYLFAYHPSLEPVSISYNLATKVVTGTAITVKVRDLEGYSEGADTDLVRPPTLTDVHKYNLLNQGWSLGGTWTATTNSAVTPVGAHTLTVASGITGITPGQALQIYFVGSDDNGNAGTWNYARGTVVSYSGTSLSMTTNTIYGLPPGGHFLSYYYIVPINIGYIDEWFTDVGLYPSNSDVWWNFKNSSDSFDPATTLSNVTLGSPAPKGHYIISAFDQQRDAASSITGLDDITTTLRPRTGTWFQGRVWYAGVDASQQAVGIASYYSWTENIYFSQIATTAEQFGKCYQANDPTSETLFNLLPTDGGVIKIQGCGAVYKLFPIQNGMLVFAANGIWFITGSQGIGFTATDYTITKISNIRSLSSTSFVNVEGIPFFWNEEGLYTVTPAQQGLGLQVESITYNTIDTMYSEIPVSSKQFARGAYNPLDHVVQWLYRDEVASSVSERYQFNRILCYNTLTKAFYTYSLLTPASDNEYLSIQGINYVPDYGAGSPTGTFKYLTSSVAAGSSYFTFSEERDETYLDWTTATTGTDYLSYFETGYKIRGQAQRRWQPGYVYMFSEVIDPVAYRIQAKYDYSTSGDSGRWSAQQLITIDQPNYAMAFRRHRLRGRGLVMQFKVSSVTGEPFNFIGWSIWETANTGV